MNMNNKKTYLTIVTYKTNEDVLEKLLDSIKSQIDKIFVIDNTPNGVNKLENLRDEKTEIIYLNENTGIAHAQNVGIKKALEEGAEFVILSDDDTIYPINYVEEMVRVFEEKKEEKIAAVAPLYKNELTGQLRPFITKTKFGFKKHFPTSGYHEVFQAIASGLVLNCKYLTDIGLMREDFFMDWVDLEWCWRAVRKGHRIIGNADVIISHELGHRSKKVGSRFIPLYNPIRHYYIVRNSMYLALYTNELDFIHKFILFIKTFRFVIVYPLLSKPFFTHLRYCLMGLWHGATKKMGKLNVEH